MAALIGAIVGIPSLRIKGLYLAIATLAGQLIIEWIINHTPAISGGAQASIQVPRPDLLGYEMKTQGQLYFFLLFFAALAILATLNLVRSRIGRAFVAIRDQDIAAEIIGINIFRYKLLAFAISSFYAGVCGVLYTYYFGIANYEAVPDRRVDRLSGHDHHRRPRLRARHHSRRHLRDHAADRPPAGRWSRSAGLFFDARRAFEHHRQHQARPVRLPDHLLSGGGAGGPEPAVAQHPQLLPRLAIFVLSICRQESEGGNAMSKTNNSGAQWPSRLAQSRWRPAPLRRRTRRSFSACSATAPAPRRPSACSFAPATTTTSAC